MSVMIFRKHRTQSHGHFNALTPIATCTVSRTDTDGFGFRPGGILGCSRWGQQLATVTGSTWLAVVLVNREGLQDFRQAQGVVVLGLDHARQARELGHFGHLESLLLLNVIQVRFLAQQNHGMWTMVEVLAASADGKGHPRPAGRGGGSRGHARLGGLHPEPFTFFQLLILFILTLPITSDVTRCPDMRGEVKASCLHQSWNWSGDLSCHL
mmetsp:Transcript_66895/g.110068  ORF Transcript_66895/g.110068 Transcript_66895/m.110068 type:complete len:211 (-) Transcript_66895:159-791(-)